jgi:hypothetical protein
VPAARTKRQHGCSSPQGGAPGSKDLREREWGCKRAVTHSSQAEHTDRSSLVPYLTTRAAAGENEANVRYVLDMYPWMQLVQHSPRLAGPGLVGRHPGPGCAPASAETSARRQVWRQASSPGRNCTGLVSASAHDTAFVCMTIERELTRCVQPCSQGEGDGGAAGAACGHEGDSAGTETWLTEAEAALVQRFDPRDETIGFFVAKFLKH